MPEYIFTGTVKLDGVTFFIEAENWTEARAKARRGEYDDYEAGGAAETVDTSIDPETCEENI